MRAVFDIGATHTRVGVSRDGRTLDKFEVLTTDQGAEGWTMVADALAGLVAGEHDLAVAGGVASQIDSKTGRLYHAMNLPEWNGVALRDGLERHLGAPVQLVNDVALVGLGEAKFGAGRGAHIVMYETVSTGVNAIRIIDGVIDHLEHGNEIGRQLVLGPGGRLRDLESLTGGAALERRRGRPPRELAGQAVWRSEARLLALGLYNSLLHWSPDVVVFGGSMMRDIDVEDIRHELAKLPPVFPAWPPIVAAQLGDLGGLYGGLALLADAA